MSTNEQEAFNIKEASHATGLTPSVLRIWELRYGWPKPKRKANGYRTYQRHQIEDLRRIASLVKAGQSISSLIQENGLPHWPDAAIGGALASGCMPSPMPCRCPPTATRRPCTAIWSRPSPTATRGR